MQYCFFHAAGFGQRRIAPDHVIRSHFCSNFDREDPNLGVYRMLGFGRKELKTGRRSKVHYLNPHDCLGVSCTHYFSVATNADLRT